MWKTRVRACINRAREELVHEADKDLDPESTIRTELDHMMRRTRLLDMEKRLLEAMKEIEAIPDEGKRKR